MRPPLRLRFASLHRLSDCRHILSPATIDRYTFFLLSIQSHLRFIMNGIKNKKLRIDRDKWTQTIAYAGMFCVKFRSMSSDRGSTFWTIAFDNNTKKNCDIIIDGSTVSLVCMCVKNSTVTCRRKWKLCKWTSRLPFYVTSIFTWLYFSSCENIFHQIFLGEWIHFDLERASVRLRLKNFIRH